MGEARQTIEFAESLSPFMEVPGTTRDVRRGESFSAASRYLQLHQFETELVMAPETSSVCPGQDLGPADQYISGPGTCVFKGRICSTLLGVRHFTQDSGKSTIVVTPRKIGNDQGEMVDNINLLPAVGNVVLARITRINRLQANAQILVVGETAIPEEFQGVIRLADVRAYEKDKIKIQTSFKPGDIVRAEVISLGDQSSYYLSTSKNELGVLFAWNELGEMMYPASWNSMRTEAGHIEERKVAKPFV